MLDERNGSLDYCFTHWGDLYQVMDNRLMMMMIVLFTNLFILNNILNNFNYL